MIYLFFLYGLSFFSFGLAVLLYPRMSNFTISTKHFWMLGVFGLIHGIVEWIDMFVLIEGSTSLSVKIISFLALPLSYIFLLCFALLSMHEKFKKLSYKSIHLLVSFLILLFFILSFKESDIFLAGNVWARYLFAIPGTFLTSYVLLLMKNSIRSHMRPMIKLYLLILSFSFFVYAIFSGIIVPDAPILAASWINYTLFQEYLGLPIQLFRTLSAFVAALTAIALFKLLRLEVETHLIKLSSAIENSGDSVLITDKQGLIEYVNPAYENSSGYFKKELIGQKSNVVKSGHHSTDFYRALWTTILSGETYKGYLLNKKKSGEIYHDHTAIAPIYNKKGSISHFVSSSQDVTELIKLEKKLEKLAATDRLTGIANRLKFDEILTYSIDRVQRYKVNLAVIMFDIDDFKQVNDSYGHLCGDDILKNIAQIANKEIRKSDLIARWGGEEFIILQPDTLTQETAILAERIRDAIERYKFKKVDKVTVSLGVTSFKTEDSRESFIERADNALYLAKERGKNRVEIK